MRTASVLIILGAALANGCSDPPPPPKAPTPPKKVEAPPKPEKKAVDDDSEPAPVRIDDKIAKMCSLPSSHFDFDSAQVSDAARGMLDALADCFVGGPAKGKGMRIVGHADPRGETEYNFALGQRRAGAVASYLMKKGLGEDRIATSSRGEIEATGTDEAGWARDRKVEVFLAE
jgi:peptidoglycan-associated lipoprotein